MNTYRHDINLDSIKIYTININKINEIKFTQITFGNAELHTSYKTTTIQTTQEYNYIHRIPDFMTLIQDLAGKYYNIWFAD